MSEESSLDIFDVTKKKRKKKKLPFDMEAAFSESAAGAPEETAGAAVATSGAEKDNSASSAAVTENQNKDDDIDLSLETLGKKKKKKKALDLEELGESLPAISETRTSAPTDSSAPGEDQEVDDADQDISMDFALGKKKKKKRRPIEELMAEAAVDKENQPEDSVDGAPVWLTSDRDYTYDELLTRVFDIMRERNPDMVTGEKRKFVMRPPQVVRLGAKKTSFVNFPDICKMLHRQPQHLLAFLFAELGTSGSVDGSNQLIIKGRFQQKQIETVLRRYIKEYVTCHTCRSAETILQKDTRLFFLQCESCGSRCTVASIKSGFQAVTGKRSALRAKAS